jgi:hypothetical protein
MSRQNCLLLFLHKKQLNQKTLCRLLPDAMRERGYPKTLCPPGLAQVRLGLEQLEVGDDEECIRFVVIY